MREKVFGISSWDPKSDLEAHISLYFRYQIRERPHVLIMCQPCVLIMSIEKRTLVSGVTA